MGRTIPSFRIAHAEEEARWRKFRAGLDKGQRPIFDQMFASARLYLSACTCAARPLPLHSILLAILFHHQKRLDALAAKNGSDKGVPTA